MIKLMLNFIIIKCFNTASFQKPTLFLCYHFGFLLQCEDGRVHVPMSQAEDYEESFLIGGKM